jgi:uncharacterized protein (TIGR03083 family)
MATMDQTWPSIHEERHALSKDLADLEPTRWSTPSLCTGWTVEDVLAHMVATAKKSPPDFFLGLASTTFRFNAMSAKDVAREKGSSGSATLENFNSTLDMTRHPPGPLMAMLGEQVVHGEDIRRPLGIVREYPEKSLTQVADFFKRSNLLIGGKRRVSGITLRATDADWSSGEGPEVHGPMVSLVLMIAGRKSALADLGGDGLALLQARD